MNPVIIDVREPSEFDRGHVEGAINIPPSQLMAGAPQLKNLPKDTPLVLYCLSGSRSNSSMRFLQAMGFTNLTNGINKEHVEKNYK